MGIPITSLDTDLLASWSTLWLCPSCKAFISVHSSVSVDKAKCPVCRSVDLLLCGRFDDILDL